MELSAGRVSVSSDFSGAASWNNRYFDTIKKMLYEDTMVYVHWQKDGTTSVAGIVILQLETLMPKKQNSIKSPCCSKRKFNLCIKPVCPLPYSTDDDDADGDHDADIRASSY